MAEALKEVSCDPKCGFSVKSHDEKEIMDIVKQHAKKKPQHGNYRQGRNGKDERGCIAQCAIAGALLRSRLSMRLHRPH